MAADFGLVGTELHHGKEITRHRFYITQHFHRMLIGLLHNLINILLCTAVVFLSEFRRFPRLSRPPHKLFFTHRVYEVSDEVRSELV